VYMHPARFVILPGHSPPSIQVAHYLNYSNAGTTIQPH